MARSCREAGAIVKTNVLLKKLNAGVSAGDRRQLEVLAQGVSCKHGSQLAIDVTLRSAVSALGEARGKAADVDAFIADGARADKESKYHEILNSRRCDLAVIASEVGGKWSKEAIDLVHELACDRARSAPVALRGSARQAWKSRWVRLLSVATAIAWAQSVLGAASDDVVHVQDGPVPVLEDVLCDAARG